MGTPSSHAVVLGAKMDGLLAARVLADFYDRVTVVERDILSMDLTNRRGRLQARLDHPIQSRDTQILDELFPGVMDELATGGVSNWNDGDLSKIWMSVGGHQMTRSGRSPNPPSVSFASRPFLEWNVRRRVRAIPNVTILDDHELAELLVTPDGNCVTGARVVDRRDDRETTLSVDLLVDASGRGSRMPMFLEDLGYGRPPKDEVMVHLAYACQLLRIPRGAVDEHVIAVFPEPGRPKMFALVGYENDTWVFGVGAMAGLKAPSRRAEMLCFAADFAPARALEAVRAAQPLSEVTQYCVPSNRWWRYDKMERTPHGLLAFGDAVCSFNPMHGQGMTVAAIEATVLRDCLRQGDRDLPRRFFRAAARSARVAWQTAVGSDLALPEVVGPRPPAMRITNWYLEQVMTAAETDPVVAGQFIRVLGMVDPPARLMRPSMLLRIADAKGRRPTGARPVDASLGPDECGKGVIARRESSDEFSTGKRGQRPPISSHRRPPDIP